MNSLDLRQFHHSRKSQLMINTVYEFEDLETQGPVKCNWDIRKSLVGLWVRADVYAHPLFTNGQTLETQPVAMDFQINEKFLFSHLAEDAYGGEQHLQSSDTCFETVDEEGTFNLKDLVRQYLILELAAHEGITQGNRNTAPKNEALESI